MSPYRLPARAATDHPRVRWARRVVRLSLQHELAFERACYIVGTIGLLATATALTALVAWPLVAP